jgi:hypothetical protein
MSIYLICCSTKNTMIFGETYKVSKEDWCQTVVIMFELALSPRLILLLLNGKKETKEWQDCNLPLLREKS